MQMNKVTGKGRFHFSTQIDKMFRQVTFELGKNVVSLLCFIFLLQLLSINIKSTFNILMKIIKNLSGTEKKI